MPGWVRRLVRPANPNTSEPHASKRGRADPKFQNPNPQSCKAHSSKVRIIRQDAVSIEPTHGATSSHYGPFSTRKRHGRRRHPSFRAKRDCDWMATFGVAEKAIKNPVKTQHSAVSAFSCQQNPCSDFDILSYPTPSPRRTSLLSGRTPNPPTRYSALDNKSTCSIKAAVPG